ncbi:MAG: SurA N-terminal domain-containing protein [Gammaproteobacteria bacterium]|nr:SurA N-terminal domain-containing protein [Gammaproteobacteria bacterium]
MLHFIRERAQGWVAWFIVGLISIPFALWGVNSYLTGPSDIVVATVNGESIQQAEYQQAMQQYRDRMRNVMGDEFDPAMFDSLEVKKSIIDGLIEQKLLLSVGQDLGQRISNGALLQMIRSTPAFQKDGQFDADTYSMMLARVGLSPERYEAELYTDSIRQEISNNVQRSTITTESALNNVLRLEKQTRDIAYGVVPAYSLFEQVSVTDDEVQSYFDTHQTNFLAPERASVDYVELSVESLSKGIAVEESDLQAFYLENQNQFVGPEQRKASHILIEGDDTAALELLDTITERLEQGEDFAALAVEFSQDSGSSQDGGDLGYFQREVMDADFEQAVFTMANIGDVSEPVKTEFGHHLIKLTGIKTPEGKSFSDSKADVEQLYRKQQAEDLFYEQAEQLADLSYEDPDSLDVVAEALSLEIKTSQEFIREGNTTGIAKDQKVADVIFSEDVLVNDLNSAVIEVSKSHLIVVHKNKHVLASQLAFESVAPAITEQLRFEHARDQAAEQGEVILSKLKSGEDALSLFAENEWHATQTLPRVSDDVSDQVLSRAFSMAKPSSEAQYMGFTASNGNYVILKLSAVTEGDYASASDEEQDGLYSHLSRTYADSELQSFINSVRSDADIEVFEQYM